MLPDVRVPEAVLHLRKGSIVSFPLDRVDQHGFRLMVPKDLDVRRATIKLVTMQSMRNSTGNMIEIPATVKEVRVERHIAVDRTIPRDRGYEGDDGITFSLRQWSRNGAVIFEVKLLDEKRRAALERREKVEATLLPGHPCTVTISTSAVRLAALSLPTPISLNDITIKVGRRSGTLEVSIPAAQCSPLSSTTPLPRAISDGCTSGLLSALPLASDDVLQSLSDPNGWLNNDLKVRTVAPAIRTSRESGMFKLRESLDAQYGQSRVSGDRVRGAYWGGRGPVLLRAKDGTPDVLLLLASGVRYDWTYGLLINGAACVLTEELTRKASAEIFGALPPEIRPESMDPLSDEASLWREHYLPAAMELSRVTRGLAIDPACVCGSPKCHGNGCKKASQFWLSWLSCKRLPTSPRGMSYFSPIVLFPLYSPLTKLSVAFPWNNPQSTPSARDISSATKSPRPQQDQNVSVKQQPCKVCGGEGTMRCSRCKNVTYCSVECQRKYWKMHKKACV